MMSLIVMLHEVVIQEGVIKPFYVAFNTILLQKCRVLKEVLPILKAWDFLCNNAPTPTSCNTTHKKKGRTEVLPTTLSSIRVINPNLGIPCFSSAILPISKGNVNKRKTNEQITTR